MQKNSTVPWHPSLFCLILESYITIVQLRNEINTSKILIKPQVSFQCQQFPTDILLLFQDLIQDLTLHLAIFLLTLPIHHIFSIFLFLVLNTSVRQQEVILYNVPKFVVFWWLEWHYTFWKEHHSVSQGVHNVKIPITCDVYFDRLVKVHSASFYHYIYFLFLCASMYAGADDMKLCKLFLL